MPDRRNQRSTGETEGKLFRENFNIMLFAALILLRIVNALSIKTFFQPDEYFQSLEPAWQSAFGESGNAWITWV